MSNRPLTHEEVTGILLAVSRGVKYKEVAKQYGRSVKQIDALVSRHREDTCRAFNFPAIIHAERFGAK